MKQFDILKRPMITEKTLAATSSGQYAFEVDRRARKGEIAAAVETAFGVKVVAVKTANLKGKKRRFGPRRKEAMTSPRKKAFVHLAPNQTIALFSTGGEKEKEGVK